MAKKECKKKHRNGKGVRKPDVRFVCSKCGLTASFEKHLCKPVKKA